MITSKVLLTLFVLTFPLVLSNGLPDGKNVSKPRKQDLSLTEKTFFQTISSLLKSNIFQRLSNIDKILSFITELEPSPQDYPKYLFIDQYFVDYRQLLTQAIKISKDSVLPEVDWTGDYDVCWIGLCFNFTLSLTSSESKLIGTQSITSKTDVTPTTFKNTFTVPYFRWSSPNLHFKMMDKLGKDTGHLVGYHITVTNFTIGINADYEYIENLGIHLSNFSIDYNVDNMTTLSDNVWFELSNGEIERYGSIFQDLTNTTMNDWRRVEQNYTKTMELNLNCFLTNGKFDEVSCPPITDESYQYYNFLIMELIQTIGLGSLLD